MLSGQFTLTDSDAFKEIMEQVGQHKPRAIIIDFSDVDFIDSAGLGMLLLMRDTCQGKNISISLKSTQGQVKKIFGISRFDQLFTVQ